MPGLYHPKGQPDPSAGRDVPGPQAIQATLGPVSHDPGSIGPPFACLGEVPARRGGRVSDRQRRQQGGLSMQWRWPIPLTIFLILVVVPPLHAQAPAGTPSEAATPIEALHQVQSNDNLHLLAAYYYGDARQWGQILHISLSPSWNPSEPYNEWRRRVHDLTPPAMITMPEARGQRPAAPKETSPGEGTPSAAPEGPAAPPKEEG